MSNQRPIEGPQSPHAQQQSTDPRIATTPSARGSNRRLQLPENHLALVVEDLFAAVDASKPADPAPEPDLRAVLLYSWATGVRGAGEIARREALDPGLRYLLRGQKPSAPDIRAFRDVEAARLEPLLANVFTLCQRAGLASLGELWLDRSPSERGKPPASEVPVWLARQVLTSSRAADARESGERPAGPVPLPPWATTRAARSAALRAVAGGSRRVSDHARPAAQLTAVIARCAAVLILLVGGLMIVRWLATGAAPLPARATTSRAPVTEELIEEPPPLALAPTTADPIASSELVAAHDEAMRLGFDALDADDLLSARSFYQFARGTMPDDEEAETRLRQLQTVLLIGTRRDGWSEVLEDLADLRELAPGSPTVLRAYVDGLVGAGREALDDRNLRRAGELCGEATRWFPDRNDARQCLSQSGFAPTSTSLPTARPTPIPPPPTAIATQVLPTTVPALTDPASPPTVAASPTPLLVAPIAPPAPPSEPSAVVPSLTLVPAVGLTIVPTRAPPSPTP